MMRIDRPRLYLVTDTTLCGGFAGVLTTVQAAAENGIDVVQVRDHRDSTRQLAELTTRLLALCHPLGVPVVVDDRLDVALAVGADGVHLGQSDLDPAAARRLASLTAGPDFHIGWSVTDAAHVNAAQAFDAGTINLLGVGPYRATPTKPDAAAPLGLEGVGGIVTANTTGFPTVAIGGIKTADVEPLLAAGVDGVAVVSAICGQPDPAEATRHLRQAVDASQTQQAQVR